MKAENGDATENSARDIPLKLDDFTEYRFGVKNGRPGCVLLLT